MLANSRSVGIDPAPKKGLHCFDAAGWRHVELASSRSFLAKLAVEKSILVCWDAPLTGPPANALKSGELIGSILTQRPIESFFCQAKWLFKAPKGISVRPYSGCPHWTISRSLLGLPRVGPYDQSDGLPFQLCTTTDFQGAGAWVVEVHPALAMWLWTKESRCLASWEYKSDIKVAKSMLDTLLEILSDSHLQDALKRVHAELSELPDDGAKGFDDILDACIAYILGELWINNDPRVMLLGDNNTGAMLLPRCDRLVDQWDAFCSKNCLYQP